MPWTTAAKIVTVGSSLAAFLAVVGAIIVNILKGTFRTVEGCEKEKINCIQSHIVPLCLKIDKIRAKLDQMDQSRLEAGTILADKLEAISKHMGGVEQYMKDHK